MGYPTGDFAQYRYGFSDILPRYGDPWIHARNLMDRKPKERHLRTTPKDRKLPWIRAGKPKDDQFFYQTIELTGKGNELVYDTFGARWFRSSFKAVQEANEAFITQCNEDGVACYCDWYYLQGISPSDLGYRYGYSQDGDYALEIIFNIRQMTKDEFNRNCDWRVRDINEDVILTGPDPHCLPFDSYWEV